jgi:hypothetical protein
MRCWTTTTSSFKLYQAQSSPCAAVSEVVDLVTRALSLTTLQYSNRKEVGDFDSQVTSLPFQLPPSMMRLHRAVILYGRARIRKLHHT